MCQVCNSVVQITSGKSKTCLSAVQKSTFSQALAIILFKFHKYRVTSDFILTEHSVINT